MEEALRERIHSRIQPVEPTTRGVLAAPQVVYTTRRKSSRWILVLGATVAACAGVWLMSKRKRLVLSEESKPDVPTDDVDPLFYKFD